jgi:hypothetical protein
MTTPAAQVRHPGGGTRGRRQLGLVSAALVALTALFVVGTIAGIVILREAVAAGLLFAAVYLVGALLSLRIRSVVQRARAVATGDAVEVAELTSASDSARGYGRAADRLAMAVVAVGAIFSLVAGGADQVLLAMLCALPMMSLGSVARSLTRRLRRLLPPSPA